LKVHIKRKHGGFLLDRSSDRYMGSNPFHNIGSATIADSVGNTFEPTYLHQQAPVGTSQYSTSPIHLPTMDEQRYGSSLSRETKLKELKRLAYRYPRFHNTGPDEIVRYAAYWSINGDNTFLDAKLEQLSRLDSYNTLQNRHNIE
ncbi:MAG: hypothetical protein WA364_07800, partial [Candidatus Nitrosopolaris sp.]